MNDQEILILEVGSVNDAAKQAAASWSVSPEDVVVKVLEEEKSFFGLLGRKLRVEVRPGLPLVILRGRRSISEILSRMQLNIDVSVTPEERINLSGADAGVIIGKYGETMKALEYIVNLTERNDEESPRIRLDSDGYRVRREQSLQRLAQSAARKAVRRGKPTYLEPMTSWERRIIHIALKDDASVETRSVGEAPARKVVVWPAASKKTKSWGDS